MKALRHGLVGGCIIQLCGHASCGGGSVVSAHGIMVSIDGPHAQP